MSDSNITSRMGKGGVILAGIATILLSILANAIYESIVKPGTSVVYDYILQSLSFALGSARDKSYKSAALDPTAVPSLFILILILLFVVVFFIFSNLFMLLTIKKMKKNFNSEETKNFKIVTDQDIKKKMIRLTRFAYFVLAISIISGTYGAFTVIVTAISHNNSVLVWRVFQNKISAISPFVSPEEIVNLKSQFSLMESKNDYLKIDARIEEIAQKNTLRLYFAKTW